MGSNDKYKKTLNLIFDSVDYIRKVDNDKEMDNAYVDNYTTKQQRLRDKKVTELLEHYVAAYKYKNQSNKWYKSILVGCSCSILIAFSVVFIVLICNIGFTKSNSSMNELVELISICITFLTLIVGILKIVAKYVFPDKEEEYITRIVEIIQNNDLENKKENIKVQSRMNQKDKDIENTQISEL